MKCGVKYDPKKNIVTVPAGSPAARTLSLSHAVRDKISADEIAQFWVDLLRNPLTSIREKITAATELSDRGWGKAPVHVVLDDVSQPKSDTLSLANLTREQLRFLKSTIEAEETTRNPRLAKPAKPHVEINLDNVDVQETSKK